ncbi:thioesterase family protein [Paenibacillus apiarius]|uniref:Thioesterase n=1 Tax=Paenibacillus apiarius TaxID=46240 RepID=A0ABT4DX72_9BACL|nr:thioesterase [Paenibacillus apiarius]MCY9515718.1 thioesterase [Paenibacillus apiarius]MCY9521949.1 thioesterase [Paenibacillus apiarius]MCY9550495.1 thioesterase [Paenibacillus apiarius]MCY9559856.1 thioesterase [Paenibacillus apiarius]MCY9683460.1 thioesterase [Paenibacillus apiarius]
MKPGLHQGAAVSFDVTVTPDMRPAFDGIVVHEVMSTVVMIYYMEKAGREIIVPFLEEWEEGSGYAVDIKHVGPAVVGQVVTFRAVCSEVAAKRVICHVTAETDFNLVGAGLFTQAIFDKEAVAQRFMELRQKVESGEKGEQWH